MTVGYYHDQISDSFSGIDSHAARWGRQAEQSKATIQAWVEEHQPDYLFILLGFNDLGWFVSGPEGLILAMGDLVSNARKAKSDIKILLGNVVDRTLLAGRDDLVENTKTYNNLLRESVVDWSQDDSPVVYVDVNANYDCHPEGCPDGHDGLHPNSMGEYHIAEAFAQSLKENFGFTGPDFEVPPNSEPREISTPTGVTASSQPEGIRVTWDRLRSARGYDIRSRVQGMSDWWSEGPVYPETTASWSTWVGSGQTWEFQVRMRGDNDDRSDWSPLVSATADVQTAPGPSNIVAVSSGDGIQVTWDAVTGYDINRYGVLVWDRDQEGSFAESRGASATSFLFGGLTQGHTYSVWVETWVNINGGVAGGVPASAGDVVAGGASAAGGKLRIRDKNNAADIAEDEALAALSSAMMSQAFMWASTPISNKTLDA